MLIWSTRQKGCGSDRLKMQMGFLEYQAHSWTTEGQWPVTATLFCGTALESDDTPLTPLLTVPNRWGKGPGSSSSTVKDAMIQALLWRLSTSEPVEPHRQTWKVQSSQTEPQLYIESRNKAKQRETGVFVPARHSESGASQSQSSSSIQNQLTNLCLFFFGFFKPMFLSSRWSWLLLM